MPTTLKVEISKLQDVTLIKLIGEARLDVEDAAFQLDRVVAMHPHNLVIVDMSQLSFMTSIGMSLLVNLRRTAAKSNGIVKLAGIQPRVLDALKHARLPELFEIHPDLASAIAHSTPAASAASTTPVPI